MRQSIPFIGLVTGCGIIAAIIVIAFRIFTDDLCAHTLRHFCS